MLDLMISLTEELNRGVRGEELVARGKRPASNFAGERGIGSMKTNLLRHEHIAPLLDTYLVDNNIIQEVLLSASLQHAAIKITPII